jgi:hypothetical protein
MKNFIVYTKEGRILRTGTCLEASFSLQAGPGELIIEGEADDATDRIVKGKVVPRTKADLVAETAKFAHVFQESAIKQKMEAILRRMAVAELAQERKAGEV